jgi:hypothetical protein
MSIVLSQMITKTQRQGFGLISLPYNFTIYQRFMMVVKQI